MKNLLLLSLVVLCASPSMAASSNHEIAGFKYQSCSKQSCIEVASPKAWLSQINFAFSTESHTTVRVLTIEGVELRKLEGVSATLQPILSSVVLDRADGTSALISIEDGSIQEIGR